MAKVLEWIIYEYQRNKVYLQESIFTFQVGVVMKQISKCIANCSYLLVLFTQAKDTVNSLELQLDIMTQGRKIMNWYKWKFVSMKIEGSGKTSVR